MRGISTCRGGCFSPPEFRPSCPDAASRPTRRPNPKISNRESLRLEIHPTQRKKRVRADNSARQNIDQPNKINSQEQSIPPENHTTNPKNATPYSSFSFRLKTT